MDSTSVAPLVSVVIGFKDWGLERLELSVHSIHDSLSGIDHEVIISDYGSEDTASIADSASRISARHVIVETDGEWSRSRALNAGVRASRGEIILATDADMLFSPRSLSRVVEQIHRHPQEVVILQCRDLPVGYSHEVVRREGMDWDHFASIGQIRPRWGMGGLVAVRREIWERLRGWDERMHTYGGEDVDLAKRAQAAGSRIDWLDEAGVGMYHIWHPSSGSSASRSAAATAAIKENRRIHTTDATFARNRLRPRYLPSGMVPLVSVLVDGDEADLAALEATLTSILGQSVLDLEVLVTGADELPNDPRVSAVPAAGASARGTFVTSARAGEIWAEDRLEALLESWAPGVGLMSDQAAHLLRDEHGKGFAPLSLVPSSTPDPRTTLVRGSFLTFPLAVTVEAWSDAVREVASSGAGWVVAPIVRHVTVTDLATDEAVARMRDADERALAGTLARCGLPVPEVPEASIDPLGILANALLHGREMTVEVEAPAAVDLASHQDLFADDFHWQLRTVRTRKGAILERHLRWTGTDTAFVTQVRHRLEESGAAVTWRYASDADHEDGPTHDPGILARSAELTYGVPASTSAWIAVSLDGPHGAELSETLSTMPAVTVVLERVVEQNGSESSWLLARYKNGNVSGAMSLAVSLPARAPITVIELPARAKGQR